MYRILSLRNYIFKLSERVSGCIFKGNIRYAFMISLQYQKVSAIKFFGFVFVFLSVFTFNVACYVDKLLTYMSYARRVAE